MLSYFIARYLNPSFLVFILNKMKTSRIVFLLVGFVISQSCSSVTEPDKLPGRRDYVWNIDTIRYPFDNILSIWGSAPNDIWIGGAQPSDLFRFDGENWLKWGTYIYSTSSRALWGTSTNNIWMGGDDGKILHFNGHQWEERFVYRNKVFAYSTITDICGNSPYNIYAVGLISNGTDDTQRGFVLHYNGNTWSEVYVANFRSQFIKINKQENKFYINCISVYNSTGKDTITFFEYDANNLNKIFSKQLNEITIGTFNPIGDKLFFLISSSVYSYKNGSFIKKHSFVIANFGYQIYGRNEMDIFLRMKDGLAHYNGSDISYLYRFENNTTSILHNAAIFDKDVFFAVNDPINNNDFILHGRLK